MEKLTKQKIKDFKKQSDNALVKYVCDYIISKWDNYDDKNDILLSVINLGCSSGIVGELVYYHDTLKFYEKFQYEIVSLLNECLDSCGCNSPVELFGKNWDKRDPLAIEDNNKNLLAWFGFEETIKNIANKFNIEW